MPSRSRYWFLPGLAVAWALVLGTAVTAHAQTPSFLPGSDLDVVVAGTLDPAARIYESQADAAILVISDRLPSPVLLHVRSRGVQAVPKARLREVGPGFSIERGDALQELGTFSVEKSEVRFQHGSVAVALRPKPALVGEHTLEELYAHTPRYKVDADAYTPDPAIIAKLRQAGAGIRVQVVFGSWCSVCKHYLPRGLAVANQVGDAIRFDYYGLPIENPWETAEVKRLDVKELPTAIVYRGDREIGRFTGGEGWTQPEARLWETISGSAR